MSTDPKDADFDVLELLERRKRDAIIEKCARKAESMAREEWDGFAIAAALRNMKDKP